MHRSGALPVSGLRKGSRMPREIRLVRDDRDVFWAICEHGGRVCALAVARDTLCRCRHISFAKLSHFCFCRASKSQSWPWKSVHSDKVYSNVTLVSMETNYMPIIFHETFAEKINYKFYCICIPSVSSNWLLVKKPDSICMQKTLGKFSTSNFKINK